MQAVAALDIERLVRMISFSYPQVLILYAIVIPLLIYFVIRIIRRWRLLRILSYKPSRLSKVFLALKIAAPLLLVLAAASPYTISYSYIYLSNAEDIMEYNNQLDVMHVLLVDVSKSMLYRDNGVSRIEYAKEFIEKYLGFLGKGDRVAIVLFSGNVSLLCNGTVEKCLPYIASIKAGQRYTAIGDAISFAVSLSKAQQLPAVAVVVSDLAWNYGGEPVEAVDYARENHVPVVFVRIGIDPRALRVTASLKDRGIRIYSVSDITKELIDEIAKEAMAEAKYEALKLAGQNFIAVPSYDYTLSRLALLLSLLTILASLVEGL